MTKKKRIYPLPVLPKKKKETLLEETLNQITIVPAHILTSLPFIVLLYLVDMHLI